MHSPLMETRILGRAYSLSASRRTAGDMPPMVVLEGIDVAFHPGEIACIVGRNGTGKTTLLQILAGIDVPTTGEVLLRGIPLSRTRAPDLSIRFISHQERGLDLRKSGGANLARAALSGTHGEIPNLVAELGLTYYIRHPARTYPAGVRLCLSVACSILAAPAVIIADDLFEALDTALAARVRAVLRSHARRDGLTVIFSTRDRRTAAGFADIVYTLDGGRLHEGTRHDPPAHDGTSFVIELRGRAIVLLSALGTHGVEAPTGDEMIARVRIDGAGAFAEFFRTLLADPPPPQIIARPVV